MGNAYLEFLLLTAFYLMSYDRFDDQTTIVETFKDHPRHARTVVDGNHMDRTFLRWIRRGFGKVATSRHVRPCKSSQTCDSLHIGFASVGVIKSLV